MKESPIEIERHNALRKQRLEEIDKLHRNPIMALKYFSDLSDDIDFCLGFIIVTGYIY